MTEAPRQPNPFRELFAENAMMDEASRMVRRFFRSGGEMGKGANYAIIALVALFYVWFLVLMSRESANFSIPILEVQIFALTLILPLSIYGAIAGERERATWEALVLTRLTPGQIIAGKLLWRMAIGLLLVAVLVAPLAVSQLVGHESNDPPGASILVGEALAVTWAFLLCAFGLWVSSFSKNSITALATCIGALLGCLAVFPILLAMFGVRLRLERPSTALAGIDYLASVLMQANPFVATGFIAQRGPGIPTPPGVPMEMPPWDYNPYAVAMPLVYLVAGAIFLRLTHARLRRLEEPKRRA